MTRHSSKTVAGVAESITGAKRYRPYPAYRDSGIEWLGEIPAHWKVAPIYARYQVALGKMLDAKKNFGDSPGEYVRNTDVQWGSVNTTNLPTMEFFPQERDRYRLQFGDLLVCEGGEVGRTAIWQGATGEYFYQKAIHRVRSLSDQEVPRFLYYTMWMLSAKGVFVAGSNPNTINHLTAVQLKNYRVLFPPCSDQNVIAAFLDDETEKIDMLVSKKERLIELLREKRTALITRAVTKGIDPDAPMKDSGTEWLGKVPTHWETVPLKWNAVCSSGNWIPVEYVDSVPDPEYLRQIPVIGGNGRMGYSDRSNVQDSVIAIGRVGALCGNVHVVAPPAWITDNALVLRIDESCFELRYLADVLRVRNLNDLADRSAQPLITGTQVRAHRLPRPHLDEQRAISSFVENETKKIDAVVEKVCEAIDRLKELRTALISAAVTGKIDVRAAVP